MWRLAWLLLISLPAWAQPFATCQLPDDARITACDYEDLSTGDTARLPVVVDTVLGLAPNYRVCKREIGSLWAPGSTHNARCRSVNTTTGEASVWTTAVLYRPASATVELRLVPGTAPPTTPPNPMTITAAGIAGGTSYANQLSGTRNVGTVTAGQLVVVTVGCFTNPSANFVAGDLAKSAGTATIGTVSLDLTYANANNGHAAVFSFIVTGSGTLTVQLTRSVGYSWFSLGSEAFNGNWDASRFVSSNTNAGSSSTAVSSGSVTTTGAALMVAVVEDVSGTSSWTVDGSWTNIFNDTGTNSSAAAYRIVSSGTTDASDWTAGIAINYAAGIVAYKEASAGGSVKRWPPQMQGGMRSLSGGMQ